MRGAHDEQSLAQFTEEHNLVACTVTLLVSEETESLWEMMVERLDLPDLAAAVQALALIGVAVVAQMDMGLLPKDAVPVDRDKLHSIVCSWSQKRFGAE